MKFEILEDGYLFFTNKIYLLDDESNISSFLKEMFLSISDVYSIELYGYFKVDIYIDGKIGIFVEMKKMDDYISYGKKIDTKVAVFDRSFYLKTNDLSLIYRYRPIYYLNDNYYISTEDVDNIFELLDFCEIEYKNIDLNKFKCLI